MKNVSGLLILVAMVIQLTLAQEKRSFNSSKAVVDKKKKSFQFLQVIVFPNDPCVAGTRNGTCYTSDECQSKGGTNTGTCANGFGVCCVFSLRCGLSSAENCTYLTLGSTTTPSPSNCVYTLCRCNPNICRIRLDFISFSISGPFVGTTVAGAAADSSGGAIGDCVGDTFALSAPGNRGSPIICGFNTGQHMYIDASTACAKAVFKFGSSAFNRMYDIKVTQYDCQDDRAGPPDCLQYFTANTGTVQSFNFQTVGNQVIAQTTHLSSQCYTMCFRRNVNNCGICFWPTISISINANNQASFGLSVTFGAITTAASNKDQGCSADYLVIPNAMSYIAPLVNTMVRGTDRFCGRFLDASINRAANDRSVCTFQRPFKIIFQTDANEMTAAGGLSNTNEQANVPGGIVGFQLTYNQIAC